MKKLLLSLTLTLAVCMISSAETFVNKKAGAGHPRYLTTEKGKTGDC